jgi:hypothetical protein
MGGGTAPLSARRRREAGEWEREGGMDPAGQERALSPRSCPRWQARGGGSAGERGGAGVTWHVSIGPRGLSVELAVI